MSSPNDHDLTNHINALQNQIAGLQAELEEAALARLRFNCRQQYPTAVELWYDCDYEDGDHYPIPTAVMLEDCSDVQIDPSTSEADRLRGDLEILFEIDRDAYGRKTDISLVATP